MTLYMKLNLHDNNIHDAVQLWIKNREVALTMYGPIEEWNVSQVTSMEGLFQDCTDFNENIGSWNTSNVTNMSHMFGKAMHFTEILVHGIHPR